MSDVAALMKRCQIGVGGRNALDDAHEIMAACYGMLGKLSADLARVTAERDKLLKERGDFGREVELAAPSVISDLESELEAANKRLAEFESRAKAGWHQENCTLEIDGGSPCNCVYDLVARGASSAPQPLADPEKYGKNYVCPQCGPDPRGADEHTKQMHTFDGIFGERDSGTAGG